MSFNFDFGNVTKQLSNGNGDLGCLGCSDFGPDSVADPGLPALKPNVAIIIIGLGFTLILVAAFALFAKFMRPHLSRQDGGSRTWEDVVKDGHLLDTNVIKNLPLVIYSSESFQGMNLDLECAVCLSSFEDKEELRLLPNCKHMFHPSCIDNWLRSHPTCPLCRSIIISFSWSLQNPQAGATPEAGEVALSFLVGSNGGAGPINHAATSQQSQTAEISGSSRRDDDSSHRIEIMVQEQQHHPPQARSSSCMRAASWCGGTAVAPRNSKEQRKDPPEGSPGGGGSSSSALQQTQRGADVHEFDPHENASHASQSAQSFFIFIPHAPLVPEEASGGGAAPSNAVTDSINTKPMVSISEGRSAISKLHEEVCSSLEASGSLRKFGKSTLQGVQGTSSNRDNGTPLEAVAGGTTPGGQGSPSSLCQWTQARFGVCTGDREDHP